MIRCAWCNLKNPIYVKYHDEEWGVMRLDDAYMFEMLLLESFQAGLSWECVLNKREAFRKAFDGFDPWIISCYTDDKKQSLALDAGIIRNKRKISAAVENARIFCDIVKEYGSFIAYIKRFWNGCVICENDKTASPLSDAISKDLVKRGMRFVGTTIIYSYLQAIGIINSHSDECFLSVAVARK